MPKTRASRKPKPEKVQKSLESAGAQLDILSEALAGLGPETRGEFTLRAHVNACLTEADLNLAMCWKNFGLGQLAIVASKLPSIRAGIKEASQALRSLLPKPSK